MEEKKLTDDEALKAVEICHTVGIHCSTCPAYKYEGDNCDNIAGLALVDYCHRLQGDNKRLSLIAGMIDKGVAVEIVNMQETIDTQKAEIERLKKEHERIAWSKQEYLDWVHDFLSTHTEMKDRGEKYEMFDRDWMCNVFWAKIKGSIEYIINLENQRNNLQKQVDELKTRDMSEMRDLFNAETDRLIEKAHQQAEKDTAKEILQELYDQIDENTPKWVGVQIKIIAKRKGVEVE